MPLLAACILTISSPSLYSETVERLALATQAEVDASLNVTEVVTSLIIETDPSLADPIVNLDGLVNLQSVGETLHIANNPSLVDTRGLLNLTDVGNVSIQSNNALTNIDGLSNLVVVDGELLIWTNPLLAEFCGLYMLFEVQGVDWNYIVDDGTTLYGFEFDQGIRQRIGSPCVLDEPEDQKPIDPKLWIQELRENGILRNWQARSLLYSIKNNCPHLLLWKVSLLVHWGTLTEELAQPLVDVAENMESKRPRYRSYFYPNKKKTKRNGRSQRVSNKA